MLSTSASAKQYSLFYQVFDSLTNGIELKIFRILSPLVNQAADATENKVPEYPDIDMLIEYSCMHAFLHDLLAKVHELLIIHGEHVLPFRTGELLLFINKYDSQRWVV
jgi:hypothetical protein